MGSSVSIEPSEKLKVAAHASVAVPYTTLSKHLQLLGLLKFCSRSQGGVVVRAV